MRELAWRAALAVVLCLGIGRSYQWATLPEETPMPEELPAEEPFGDVSFGERWYDGAQYGYRRGIIRGMTETEFGGELTATRAMAATMVWRLAGEPEVLGSSTFRDVKLGEYYTAAVVWGESRSLWEGYGDGTFRPDEAVTWGQLELVLERYMGGETGGLRVRGLSEVRGTAGEMNRGELAEALMELCEGKR